jgi:hypothetical protein
MDPTRTLDLRVASCLELLGTVSEDTGRLVVGFLLLDRKSVPRLLLGISAVRKLLFGRFRSIFLRISQIKTVVFR